MLFQDMTRHATLRSRLHNAVYETICSLSPKNTILEYIIFVATSLGFWLLITLRDIEKLSRVMLRCTHSNSTLLYTVQYFCPLLVVIGFFYHSILVISDYANYSVVSETTFLSNFVPIPAFSVCFYLEHYLRNACKEARRCIETQTHCKVSIAELNDFSLMNFNDFFKNISVRRDDSLTWDVYNTSTKINNFKKSFVKSYYVPMVLICYTIQFTGRRQLYNNYRAWCVGTLCFESHHSRRVRHYSCWYSISAFICRHYGILRESQLRCSNFCHNNVSLAISFHYQLLSLFAYCRDQQELLLRSVQTTSKISA